MPFFAPWTDVNPKDFLQAAEAGARIGLARQEQDGGAQSSRARGSSGAAPSGAQRAGQDAARNVLDEAKFQNQIQEHQKRDDFEADKQQENSKNDAAKEALRQATLKQQFDFAKSRQLLNDQKWFDSQEAFRQKQKDDAAKAANPPTSTTIHQVLNPAYSVGGSQPPYLSLTNTTSRASLPFTPGQDAGGGAIPIPNAPVNDGTQPNADDSMQPLGANQSPLNSPAPATQGVRVQNSKTGQFGMQMPDGSIVPDAAPVSNQSQADQQ
jgi:hypothetical protein